MAAVDPERWQLVEPYLDQALDLPAEARQDFVARLSLEHPQIALELQGLLAESAAAHRERFLADPIPIAGEGSLQGLRIGAYTLISPLGRGGMGTVWLAERSDGRYQGRVAVKLLNVALIGLAGEERFTREGSILATLTHPHIAHLIDAGVTSMGQPYLVLEHVEGEHIDRYCDRLQLDVRSRVRLFLDVLDAVAHAHANLVVHRDLKPSNVLVRQDGTVKLLDFGIAKLLVEDADARAAALTVEGARVLTPEYAAPEQLTGEPITTVTDVYALGILLYVLLGAPHPVTSQTASPAERLKAAIETDPPRLSAVAPNGQLLRGDLDTIVAKALKKVPAERYASVAAFADDLRRYLNHQPVSARADSVIYRASKFLRRHARAAAATAAVAVVIVGLVAFYTSRLAAERDRARVEAEKATRIAGLLTSLLTAADPYATRDREPTVRNLLDAGAGRVRADLADQPELRAQMLTVLGRVYQRLGLHATARPLLQEALAIGRGQGTDSPWLAQALNDFGVLVREDGQLVEALPALEESLAMRRRLLGDEDKDVAVTLVELGRALEDHGQLERAEPLFREALRVRQQVFGENHRETATSKSSLALLLWRRGAIDEAEPLFRDALDTTRRVLGEDHPNVASGWNNVGLMLMERGDYAGAEPMFRRALAINQRHFGARHAVTTNNRSNLAVTLREQGRFDEAQTLLADAVAIAREAHGDGHASLGGYLFNLGRVALARGDAAGAAQTLADAAARQRATLPATDWRIAATDSALGEAMTRLGRYEDAERLLTDAAKVLKDVPGRQGREAAMNTRRLAELRAVRAAPRTRVRR
jgi:tetratricopeptide (TPR) repeat protein